MRLTLAVVLLTFGCATQKPVQEKKDAVASTQGPKKVKRCHTEQAIGSNFVNRVCKEVVVNDVSDAGLDDGMLAAQRRAAQHVTPGGK